MPSGSVCYKPSACAYYGADTKFYRGINTKLSSRVCFIHRIIAGIIIEIEVVF